MKNTSSSRSAGGSPSRGSGNKSWWIVGGGILVVALALFLPRGGRRSADVNESPSVAAPSVEDAGTRAATAMRDRARARGIGGSISGGGGGGGAGDASSAAERVVSDRVYDFVRDRRRMVEDFARHLQVEVPARVQDFFAAAEGGDWGEIKRLFNTLSSEREGAESAPGLAALWPAIQEAYNVAQTAASWAPDELLEYGKQMAAGLPPGAVLLAGSEAARHITPLATQGGSGTPLVMNPIGLTDGGYLEYLAFAGGDRMTSLSKEEVQAVLLEELKRSGATGGGGAAGSEGTESPGSATPPGSLAEWVRGMDSGTAARVNASLMQLLIDKNPGVTFVLDQAGQVPSMSANAVPNGPYVELRGGGGSAMTSAQAGAAVNYWQETAQRLAVEGDGALPANAPSRASLASMAAGQAEFLASRNFKNEAEQAFQLARAMAPESLDPVRQYSEFLSANGRQAEALHMLDEFAASHESMRYAANEVRRRLAPEGGR